VKLLRIESVSELRKQALAWDDLWRRSESALPTHRAELVAQWVEHYAKNAPLVILAIEHEGQLVAGLPLVGRRKCGIPLGGLTANCWSDSGTLLLDPAYDGREAINALMQGVRRLRWPLLMFDDVNCQSAAWRQWHSLQAENHASVVIKPKYRIGQIDITHDWDAYVKAWSANHRRAIKKLRQAAETAGAVELVAHTELLPGDVEPLLHQAFEIEDRSWKGEGGTSVLRTVGAYDFFLRQAQQLAAWNQFELYFLNFRGRPIAFDFCYSAKGVLSSHKIGYDVEFRDFGPFQLLRSYQLEQLFSDPSRRLLDTMGILDEGKAKWCTRYIQSSRVVMATGAPLGSLGLSAYQYAWPALRNLMRRKEETVPQPEPGAARLLGDASCKSAPEPELAGV
jgi:CelD/BcsL family acetyltransferase involved in cellulose biosynthesis